jgi:hypothetical protein
MTWETFLKPEEKRRLAALEKKRAESLKEIRRIKDRVRRRMKRFSPTPDPGAA